MTTRKIFTSPLAIVGLSLATLVSAQNPADANKAAKATAQMGPFEVAPHWSPYDYPKSLKEGQAFHMVVKGDTLWDIAGRYLGNPFLWPQIWEANGYVKKARLIYPGDPILVPTVQLAEAAVAPAEPVAEPAPVAAPPAEALPIQPWADMDAMVSVASADTVRNAGYITASKDDESLFIKGMEAEGGTPIERRTAGTREYLYLNRGASSGVKAGDLYTINRRVREVKHPSSGKKVGYRVDTVGVARVLVVGETSSRAVVEVSGREVTVNDYLRPLSEFASPMVRRRVVVEGGDLSLDGSRSSGYVVDMGDDASTSATGGVVGVDMGSGSGLATGKVITLYRQGDRSDPVSKRPLASAVVIAIRENFSVALVVYSREEVRVGDRVLIQP